ncbi:SDR family NAD(P)-dependent oxidoreductase [Pseudonocardia pini]|uniref:SDR family NAD(P)-dependent oxidoreductase n=1 Tax=Pseudonocardia pini TaxID=2758030 RepID=UPI0015F003F4|nr:SDR family NAD(P)-dependent oxidoreductase [Pseudonocardia pini]
MPRWTADDIGPLDGRTVLVTGATSGLGRAGAEILVAKGARVLGTGRDPSRVPAGVEPVRLDLADLESVRTAAAEVRERTGDRLDVLMNNAGVMGIPAEYTVDGFERQIATNHLGHAALTWLLMPALRNGPASRVVVVSSIAHRGGGLDVDDLHFRRRPYRPAVAYSQSKLADLLFAAELDRRLRGESTIVVAAHPGMTDTDLLGVSLRARGLGWAAGPVNKVVCQRVGIGVLPQLFAAVGPARAGDYVGPRFEVRGHPAPARRSAAARDLALAARLWEVTASETGITPDPGA